MVALESALEVHLNEFAKSSALSIAPCTQKYCKFTIGFNVLLLKLENNEN